jgi:hypothetical protein
MASEECSEIEVKPDSEVDEEKIRGLDSRYDFGKKTPQFSKGFEEGGVGSLTPPKLKPLASTKEVQHVQHSQPEVARSKDRGDRDEKNGQADFRKRVEELEGKLREEERRRMQEEDRVKRLQASNAELLRDVENATAECDRLMAQLKVVIGEERKVREEMHEILEREHKLKERMAAYERDKESRKEKEMREQEVNKENLEIRECQVCKISAEEKRDQKKQIVALNKEVELLKMRNEELLKQIRMSAVSEECHDKSRVDKNPTYSSTTSSTQYSKQQLPQPASLQPDGPRRSARESSGRLGEHSQAMETWEKENFNANRQPVQAEASVQGSWGKGMDLNQTLKNLKESQHRLEDVEQRYGLGSTGDGRDRGRGSGPANNNSYGSGVTGSSSGGVNPLAKMLNPMVTYNSNPQDALDQTKSAGFNSNYSLTSAAKEGGVSNLVGLNIMDPNFRMDGDRFNSLNSRQQNGNERTNETNQPISYLPKKRTFQVETADEYASFGRPVPSLGGVSMNQTAPAPTGLYKYISPALNHNIGATATAEAHSSRGAGYKRPGPSPAILQFERLTANSNNFNNSNHGEFVNSRRDERLRADRSAELAGGFTGLGTSADMFASGYDSRRQRKSLGHSSQYLERLSRLYNGGDNDTSANYFNPNNTSHDLSQQSVKRHSASMDKTSIMNTDALLRQINDRVNTLVPR